MANTIARNLVPVDSFTVTTISKSLRFSLTRGLDRAHRSQLLSAAQSVGIPAQLPGTFFYWPVVVQCRLYSSRPGSALRVYQESRGPSRRRYARNDWTPCNPSPLFASPGPTNPDAQTDRKSCEAALAEPYQNLPGNSFLW